MPRPLHNIAALPKNPVPKKAAKGAKSWVFRFMLAGKSREMGLGPYPAVSPARAADLAAAAKELVRQGVDPITRAAEKRAREAAEAVAEARRVAEA